MPYEISRETRGVHSRFFGAVTGRDLHRNVEEISRLPEFDRLRYAISDFRDASSVSFDEAAVDSARAMLIGARYTNPNLLIALVGTDPAVMDRVRQLTLRDVLPTQPRYFRTPEDAVDWIASQTAYIRPVGPQSST